MEETKLPILFMIMQHLFFTWDFTEQSFQSIQIFSIV